MTITIETHVPYTGRIQSERNFEIREALEKLRPNTTDSFTVPMNEGNRLRNIGRALDKKHGYQLVTKTEKDKNQVRVWRLK